MIRIAGERINHLLALAEVESRKGPSGLPDRYVSLARRIGTRYNVRVPKGYRELYCRACSAYWVEGRTVRTRLRSGIRTRTCLRCGAIYRQRTAPPVAPTEPGPPEGRTEAAPEEPQLAFDENEEEARAELEGGEEGE
jgi:ribonuclease P protein subunit RPR2